MTEPFGPPPVGELPLAVAEPSRFDRARELLSDRRALGLVAAAGVAVVALAAFVVLPAVSGGTSKSSQSLPALTHHTARVASTPPPSATVPTSTVTDRSVPKIRDPFAPLYTPPMVVPAAASGGAVPAPALAVTRPSPVPVPVPAPAPLPVLIPVPAPVLPPAPVPVPVPAPTSSAPSTPAQVSPKVDFALVKLYPDNTADVTVNKTPYSHVRLNQTFGQFFMMVSISNPKSAEFYYGDQPFALAPGQHFYFLK